jgi:hypothetical protein
LPSRSDAALATSMANLEGVYDPELDGRKGGGGNVDDRSDDKDLAGDWENDFPAAPAAAEAVPAHVNDAPATRPVWGIHSLSPSPGHSALNTLLDELDDLERYVQHRPDICAGLSCLIYPGDTRLNSPSKHARKLRDQTSPRSRDDADTYLQAPQGAVDFTRVWPCATHGRVQAMPRWIIKSARHNSPTSYGATDSSPCSTSKLNAVVSDLG